MSADGRAPRRFVIRTLTATLTAVAFVLTAILVIVPLIARDHVRRSVIAKLENTQQLLAALEERRASDLRAQAATLAESPTAVPLTSQDADRESLQLARALDERYAAELSRLSGARTVILSNDRVLATTLSDDMARALTPETLHQLAAGGLMGLAGEEYVVRPLLREGDAAVYVLDSIDAAARPLIRASIQALALVAVAGLALAAGASLWLARSISRPVDALSQSLTDMTQTRTFDRPLPVSGTSVEIDRLTGAFNTMLESVKAAEAETANAYLEAIRALAMALDARDPYTAGHSERVSVLAVAIGRQMQLSEHTLEVLRLGALLHDIGKIGVRDDVLRKPAKLTAEEYELIKAHPTVGSRILRNVRFIEPHLPMVELHHERPDGSGYPYGLKGDDIPILARIVHVADAFDAMTSARAYRPALPADQGLAELQRCAGTDFDPQAVAALAAVLGAGGTLGAHPMPDTPAALQRQEPPRSARPTQSTPAAQMPRRHAPTDPLDEFASEEPSA